MTPPVRPSLFIGSSVEGLDVAYALQECLEYDTEPTVWPQGVFNPTSATLSDLLEVAHTTDFAAFVFTPDDVSVMRRREGKTPRDNVVFELGLFIGARGPTRCFFLVPSDAELRLPTDLLGLTPLSYVANRTDANLVAALGPAANRIRRALRAVGSLVVSEVAGSPVPEDPSAETAEFIRRWNSGELLVARERLRQPFPMHLLEDETGEAAAALKKVFAFMESMADGVLSERLREPEARAEFAEPLHAVWARASIFLAPLSQAQEWWNPLPRLAVLDQRWSGAPR